MGLSLTVILIALGSFLAGIIAGLKLFPYLAMIFYETWD